MTSFDSLNLAEPLSRALTDLGHDTPTPIQAQAIPSALEGRDVMGIAQTGTGKTAGFALPTLHHIFTENHEPPKRGARVLILAPTRELASQIAEAVRNYGRHIDTLSVACVFGGVPIARQIKRLTGGNDILVATPGRLIDLLDRKAIKLDKVEVLILDEADQMLDMGFIHALKKIVKVLPKDRQTLFFSATLAPKIKQLSKQFLIDPVHVSVTPANTTAEKVVQTMYKLKVSEKQERLGVELLREGVGRSLVFTRTKHGADRVVKRLAAVGIGAVAIHGNKSQAQRTRALEAFRAGRVKTMIATDVAARGIDIPEITHVFNFELPNVPEQYVHRIGRTARAERSGHAIALVATDNGSDEAKYLRDIEKLLGEKIPLGKDPADMAAAIKDLRARPALPKPEAPKPDARKGRGKSKKKGRFSKDRNSRGERSSEGGRNDGPRSAGARNDARRGDSQKSRKPQSQKPRSESGNSEGKPAPSREGRSRKAPSRQDRKRTTAAQMSGSPLQDTRSRKPASNPSAASGANPKPSKGRGSGGDSAPKRRNKHRGKGKRPGGNAS